MFKLTSERGSIIDRATSGFPLSIGTSIAFESLFSPRTSSANADYRGPTVSVGDYDQLWVNVATLLRNAIHACDRDILKRVDAEEALMLVQQEMDIIRTLLQVEGGDVCRPMFYACSYDRLHGGSYGRAVQIRPTTTPRATEQELVFRHIVKQLRKKETMDFVVRDDRLDPPIRNRSLVITHGTLELLHRRQFNRLDLLESHTGKLKSFTDWNTKYYPVPQYDMSILPWQRMLLLVLGDKSYIKPMDIKIRRAIMDIAIAKRWTPVTTPDKIRNDIQIGIKEPMVSKMLQNLIAE